MTVTFPVVDGMGMIARTAAPPKVGGASGPRRLVTKVWTTRWWLAAQREQAGRGQQQERGHEQGGRGAAGPRLALAGDLGGLGEYQGAEVAGGRRRRPA